MTLYDNEYQTRRLNNMSVERYKNEYEYLSDCDLYTKMCYHHALEVFEMLCKNCSGYSMQLTMDFLTKMVNGHPLTPIKDEDFCTESAKSYCRNDGSQSIQCPRMSRLFKYIHTDGTITYSDVDRVLVKVLKNSTHWTNGFITSIVDKMYPITLPYMPPNEKFIANINEYLFDKKNGDYDAIHFVSLKHPDGKIEDVNRYFIENHNTFMEVDEETFNKHKSLSESSNADTNL